MGSPEGLIQVQEVLLLVCAFSKSTEAETRLPLLKMKIFLCSLRLFSFPQRLWRPGWVVEVLNRGKDQKTLLFLFHFLFLGSAKLS